MNNFDPIANHQLIISALMSDPGETDRECSHALDEADFRKTAISFLTPVNLHALAYQLQVLIDDLSFAEEATTQDLRARALRRAERCARSALVFAEGAQ